MVKIISWIKTGIAESKEYLLQIFFDSSKSSKVKIPAILIFILGNVLILISLVSDLPFVNNYNGIILFFVGIFIFLFFPERRIQKDIEFYIFFFLIGWLILMSFIAMNTRLNFFLFTVIGILICKELANGYLTPLLKKKLSFLTIVLFSMSIILIIEKVINYFSII